MHSQERGYHCKEYGDLGYIHTMTAHLKTVKNVTVAKFELAFTRCRNSLKTVGNLTAKNSLQDFDTKEMYLHPKSRSGSFQKRRKMFCFHHFRVFTPRDTSFNGKRVRDFSEQKDL